VAFRRIEADGKKRLCAACEAGGQFDLKKRARKIVRHKPAYLVQFDMIVVAGVGEVGGKRLPSPSLIALDNHASRGGRCRVVGRREAEGAGEGVAHRPDVVAHLFNDAAVGPASFVGGFGKLVEVAAHVSEQAENLQQEVPVGMRTAGVARRRHVLDGGNEQAAKGMSAAAARLSRSARNSGESRMVNGEARGFRATEKAPPAPPVLTGCRGVPGAGVLRGQKAS